MARQIFEVRIYNGIVQMMNLNLKLVICSTFLASIHKHGPDSTIGNKCAISVMFAGSEFPLKST